PAYSDKTSRVYYEGRDLLAINSKKRWIVVENIFFFMVLSMVLESSTLEDIVTAFENFLSISVRSNSM
ncbi:MAG: hypothetical protein D6707_11080, partial [Bacteroidetes bacterium]